MKMRRVAAIAVLIALGLIGVALAAVLSTAPTEQARARQRLEIPREWARLAPYPDSATGLRATTSGGMFTRSFRVRFTAPVADVERWLRDSPGPREGTPDRRAPGRRRYVVAPGGGANRAVVTVDDATGEVEIDASWS
jgi:type II secretory pathway pseudopilin PulG